jgi:hypothetical protein
VIPLTAERAPGVTEAMRNRANALARVGEIAIIGTAMPWNEYSLSHKERVLPGEFGAPRSAPPLLAEHTGKTKDGGPAHPMAKRCRRPGPAERRAQPG